MYPVGTKVRLLRNHWFRYEDWPDDFLAGNGTEATIRKFHPAQPSVRLRGNVYPAIAAWYSLEFGPKMTGIGVDADDEGRDWELA